MILYPHQCNYRPTISPLKLLYLSNEIRYMIFKFLLHYSSIKVYPKLEGRLLCAKKYYTVHGCVDLLNFSHQLLNPAYSSSELATEAADIFYKQNIFDVNILNLPSFIWTLKHMPSIGPCDSSIRPFDPLLAISHLRLYLNCDGTLVYTSRDEDTPIIEHEWSDTEKEDLAKVCTAITTNFPALRDVEFHVRKQAMCSGLEAPIPDADPPLYLLEKITPTIKELMDHGDRSARVFLHGQRWDKLWPRGYSEEVTEDITGWWDSQTKEDEKLLSKENFNWLESVEWHFNKEAEDWKRKGAIEGANMRRQIAERNSRSAEAHF